MYHLARQGGPVRKSLRPPLDLVDQRRRERLQQEPEPPWRSGRIVRVCAATVLAGCCACVALGLALVSDPSAGQTAADAATLPAITAPHRHVERRQVALRVTARGVQSRERRRANVRTSHRAAAHRSSLRRDPPPTANAQPSPSPAAAEQTTAPAPASGIAILTPWHLTADGAWQTTVALRVPGGVDPHSSGVSWSANGGADVLPLDVNAPGAPGAIVTASGDAATVAVTAASSALQASQELDLPAIPQTGAMTAAAEAVGPHLVDVGWSTGASVDDYKVYRRAAGASHGTLLASVSPDGRAWQDDTVRPGVSYSYTVIADGAAARASTAFVDVPSELPRTSIDAISGKGMFLYFSPNTSQAESYTAYDPDAVIARARAGGISHIELRLARGTFTEASTPQARAWLDALIDKAAAAGIKLIAWQVPRRSTADDAATAVAAAGYETPSGNGFAGLALDIEDGDEYMGDRAVAKQRMVDDIQMVRKAVGADYLLVATVMSPALTHWTNERYPFARIAPYASVLQPMEYWHHFYSSTHHAYSQTEVASACADSVALTQRVAGRDIPINVAGQSDDLGATGAPAPEEIGWCLAASRSAGAIGQTFFDWRGTNDDDWSEIAGFAW